MRDNRETVLDIPLPATRESRFLQVVLEEHIHPWELHEIEIYARGFVRQSTYVSNVVDLGRPMALGQLRWAGARVLRYGDPFPARVWDSAQPQEVRQGVVAGDAPGDHEGNRVTVATSLTDRALLDLRVTPAVTTPNGDGRNDEAWLEYEILDVTGAASVTATVSDLAGGPVRLLLDGARTTGRYRRSWDGRGTVATRRGGSCRPASTCSGSRQ